MDTHYHIRCCSSQLWRSSLLANLARDLRHLQCENPIWRCHWHSSKTHTQCIKSSTAIGSDKRQQLLKMKLQEEEEWADCVYHVYWLQSKTRLFFFFVYICHQDESFSSEYRARLEVEHFHRSNLHTRLSQIWVICTIDSFCQSRAEFTMGYTSHCN